MNLRSKVIQLVPFLFCQQRVFKSITAVATTHSFLVRSKESPVETFLLTCFWESLCAPHWCAVDRVSVLAETRVLVWNWSIWLKCCLRLIPGLFRCTISQCYDTLWYIHLNREGVIYIIIIKGIVHPTMNFLTFMFSQLIKKW